MNSGILAAEMVNTNFISFYQSVNEDEPYIECFVVIFPSIFLIAYLFKIINN